MSTRSQKRKTVEELASGEFESNVEDSNNPTLEQVPGPSCQKSTQIRSDNLDETKDVNKDRTIDRSCENLCGEPKGDDENDSTRYQKENYDGSGFGRGFGGRKTFSPVIPTSSTSKSGKQKKKHNCDTIGSRNVVKGVLNDATNVSPKNKSNDRVLLANPREKIARQLRASFLHPR